MNLIAAMEAAPKLVDWFNALPSTKVQVEMAIWMALPVICALLATLTLMISIRKIYNPSDKACLPISAGIAAFTGALFMFFLMGPINGTLPRPLYDSKAVLGAACLTPFLNYILFRATVIVLVVVYVVSDYVPKDKPYSFLGKPGRILARSAYFFLTTKDITSKIKED